jgi:hypothetical protein
VRGHDERCARRRERGEQAGRDEEVGVDDIRTEPAGCRERPAPEAQIAALAAAPALDDRPFELVPSPRERPLEPLHEDAEIGVGRPGIHLGDEQDPHGGTTLTAGRYARWAS